MSRGRVASAALVPIAMFVAGRRSSPTVNSGAGNGNAGKSSGQFGLALMAKPRHPAAVLLWTDWMLTKGQAVIARSKRISPGTKVPGHTGPVPAGTTVHNVPQDLPQQQSKKWESAYGALLRHARKGS